MSAGLRYRKGDGVVSRKIRGEHVLVPIVGSSEDLDSIFTLNPTAGLILERASAGDAPADIGAALERAFDVDAATASADVERTLQELVGIGALSPAEA